MRVKVDRDACQTAATCLMFQFNQKDLLYELDDESIAVLKTKDGRSVSDEWVEIEDLAGYDASKDKSLREILVDSAKACPFNAIIVEDDNGKVVWPDEI